MTVIEYHAYTNEYLTAHFESLRRYSPNTDIHVIADDTVCKLVAGSIPVAPYKHLLDDLDAVFQNYSPNPRHFELVCIQRWFVLYAYAKQHNIQEFWTFDRDILVFSDLDAEAVEIRAHNISLTLPLCSFYCRDIELLKPWLDWLMSLYSHPEKLKKILPLMPNISDMNLAYLFWHDKDIICLPGAAFGSGAWDNNLTTDELDFEMHDGSKVLRFIKGYPEARNKKYDIWIRMKTLHCHGSHKARMHEYLALAKSSENTTYE